MSCMNAFIRTCCTDHQQNHMQRLHKDGGQITVQWRAA